MPVLVITGQSGAGKGTLIERLLQRFPQLELAVSATTRERRLAGDEFLEYHVFPWGQRSGTLSSEIERIAADGRVCVLELETEGALAVADRVSEAVTIFITAPIDELERRLRERATESAGEIDERLEVARQQLEVADRFDYVIENDDLERAAAKLAEIVGRLLAPAGTMARP